MENENVYVYGGRSYTYGEMITIGRQHRSKKYWGKRGAGIGLMAAGGIGLTVDIPLFIAYLNLDYDPLDSIKYTYLAFIIIFSIMFILGIIFFSISFAAPSDEDALYYAHVYLSKVEARNQRMESRSEVNQLVKYKKLLDSGAITQEEYEAKKRELL